jgi:uncharacterized lipoprotein
MRSTSSFLRPLAFAVLAIAVLGVSGCKWFHKGNPDYALSPEARPLEVPPDLNLPNTAGAMKLPPAAGDVSAQPGAVASATGFNVAGARDDVFARIGTVLDATNGVSVANRSQLLGTYDVSYEGSNFLVRAVAVEAGTYVSAIDQRGLPAAGSAPKLIAELKAKLGG